MKTEIGAYYARTRLPELLRQVEVSNVIARAEAKGLLAEAQSQAFLEMLSSAPIRAKGAKRA